MPASSPAAVSQRPASSSASGTNSTATAASRTPPPNAVAEAAMRGGRRQPGGHQGAGNQTARHHQTPTSRGTKVAHVRVGPSTPPDVTAPGRQLLIGHPLGSASGVVSGDARRYGPARE